jgi:hypothetical protein
VCDLHGHAARIADANRLGDGVQQHGGLATHVREVIAAARAQRLRERDELVRLGVGARRIDEPRGKSPRAGVHRVAEPALHRAQLTGVGGPRLEAQGGDAQGAVADEVDHVHRGSECAQQVEVLTEGLPRQIGRLPDATDPALHERLLLAADRRRGERAHADDFRRHTLADLGLGGRAREVEEVGVRVHVDEAGRDRATGHVEHAIGGAGQARRHRDNALALDRHVRRAAGLTSPIDHGAAADQERPGHGYSSAIVIDVIRSPCLMRSTCSMPLVTLPNTV